MTVALAAEDRLDEDERAQIGELSTKLHRHQYSNANKFQYYDGEIGVDNIGIAIPQSMVNVKAVLAWPEIVVDALDERIEWLGWESISDDPLVGELDHWFQRANLSSLFDMAKHDAFVTGVGFLTLTQGDESKGEPKIIATEVSPFQATYVWDRRRNRMARGLTLSVGPDGERITTLFLPNETVTVTQYPGEDEVVHRFRHNTERCRLIVWQNKRRSGDRQGRSELTRPIRYYTDHGLRTILGMEYNREIYTTPQRHFKNIEPEQLGFEETDTPWDVVQKGYQVAMSRAVIMPPNEKGEAEPSTGQYQAAPPTPYIDQLKMLAGQVAAATGIPVSQFGFITENPPSADAVRVMESRHVKRADRRIKVWDPTMVWDLAHVAVSIITGEKPDPEFLAGLVAKWANTGTPTVAAAQDAASKAIEVGMAPADSPVMLRRAGFKEDEIKQLERDRARSVSRRLVEAIRDRQMLPGDRSVDRLVGQMGVD